LGGCHGAGDGEGRDLAGAPHQLLLCARLDEPHLVNDGPRRLPFLTTAVLANQAKNDARYWALQYSQNGGEATHRNIAKIMLNVVEDVVSPAVDHLTKIIPKHSWLLRQVGY